MVKEKTKKSARKLFYEEKESFQFFSEISEAIVKYACEMVRVFKENYLKPRQDANSLKRTNYINTLDYLTSENAKDMSFDEKLLILILVVDPDLLIYKTFCETSFISKEQIENEKSASIRDILKRQRVEQFTDIEVHIIEQLGFYDNNLLYYELFYMNKIVCRHKINTTVLRASFPKYIMSSLEDFCIDDVTETRFKEIENLAKEFLDKIDVSPTLALVSNAIIYQGEQLDLHTVNEQLIFFILTIDPNFYLLTICEEESRVEEIKRRAFQELGFYDENIIKIEKMLVKRFYPEKMKKISTFSYANKKEKK